MSITENGTSAAPSEDDLKSLFGPDAATTPLDAGRRMGRRVRGVDLSRPLVAKQARYIVALLDHHHIVCFESQDRFGFGLSDLERLGNHFGAPIPHPSNYANYGSTDEELRLKAVEDRAHTLSSRAFPDDIVCVGGAGSPAVLVVTNLIGSGPTAHVEVRGGLHWHTDIEFEPEPLSTSIFYVQRAPARTAQSTWVTNPPRDPGFYHPESPERLQELREDLPLNGETAFADTAAAYAAMPAEAKAELDAVMVRRRFRRSDRGWLVPLVHVNPRTGTRSLHSPIWASRGKNVAPAEIDGLGRDESRRFFDRLEEHVLQPQFRYDQVHNPGDVTMWDNFATLHNAPPSKAVINNPDDARLMYRVSCKGAPSYQLPRPDSRHWLETNLVPPYRSPESVVTKTM